MGYPMTYVRVVARNGLQDGYELRPTDDAIIAADPPYARVAALQRAIAGDLRRLERDQRDARHLGAYAHVAGITPEQARAVLDALFAGMPEDGQRWMGEHWEERAMGTRYSSVDPAAVAAPATLISAGMTDRPRDPTGQEHALDLGDGHWLDWIVAGPDAPRIGAVIYHLLPAGQPDYLGNGMCASSCWFDVPGVPPERLRWQVQGPIDEHLTMSPSLLCGCGDHGFIRDGRWVRA